MLSVSFCSSISQHKQEIYSLCGYWSCLWLTEQYWRLKAKPSWGSDEEDFDVDFEKQDSSDEEEDPGDKREVF